MYRLHGFAQSGNAYKVALLLQALRQLWTPVHLKFADFAGGMVRSEDWRQDVNAMGEVPVLEVGDQKLTQSAASSEKGWLLESAWSRRSFVDKEPKCVLHH